MSQLEEELIVNCDLTIVCITHTFERLVIIILAISQYSIFDTRYGFGLAKQTGIVRNL